MRTLNARELQPTLYDSSIRAVASETCYGEVHAVHGVSFDAQPGEIFGSLGRNGSGKTTTVRMLTTVTRPTSGHAYVGGVDVVQDPARVRALVGVTMQEAALDSSMTGREHLELVARLWGFSKARARERGVTARRCCGGVLVRARARDGQELSIVSAATLMFVRTARHARREPAVAYGQPILGSVLIGVVFGAMFGSVDRLPGFPAESYLEWLVPGTLFLSAVVGAGFSAAELLRDIESGYLERIRLSPASPSASRGELRITAGRSGSSRSSC